MIAWARRGEGDRPYIPCEYQHAMGNSNSCFKEYWDAFEKYDGLQDGFLWEWVDHGLKQTTPTAKVTGPTAETSAKPSTTPSS